MIYRKYNSKPKWIHRDRVVIALGVTFAITTEVLQLLLTTYRAFDIYDILADICGVVVGIIILRLKIYKDS